MVEDLRKIAFFLIRESSNPFTERCLMKHRFGGHEIEPPFLNQGWQDRPYQEHDKMVILSQKCGTVGRYWWLRIYYIPTGEDDAVK